MTLPRRQFLHLAAGAAALPAVSRIARAQTSPMTKPVRIIIGFAAGGSTDIMARLMAGGMKNYAPTVVIENRPGASGRIAIETVKAAAPDGSVLLFMPSGGMTLFPHVYKTLRYVPLQDFIPISTVAVSANVLAVGPKVPDGITTVADFIRWCRANPSEATYGTAGVGTNLHFTGVMLARAAGFEFTHVPYQGVAPAIQDVLGGRIASSIQPVDSAISQIQSGRVRALATTGSQRSTFLRGTPTMKEAGYPSIEVTTWFGFLVPARTPREIVEKLNGAIQEALSTDQVKSGMAKLFIEASAVSMDDFARLIASESEQWGAIVRASGFTPED